MKRSALAMLFFVLFFIPGPSGQAVRGQVVSGQAVRGQVVSGQNWNSTVYEIPRGDLRILWYNVENLFHPSVDTLAESSVLEADREFSPEGIRNWSRSRYRAKVTGLARVIVAAGQWNPPGLVGLCEVENGLVLEDLVNHPILESCAYSYLHRDGPDHRGMDVALLFRENRFHLKRHRWIEAPRRESYGATRMILHARGSWGQGESLDLFLVHLISRYGGSGSTAPYRKMQVEHLLSHLDSARLERPGSLLLVAGDFNEGEKGWSMEPLYAALPGGDSLRIPGMEAGGRSYKYRGVWSGIDRFLVSGPEEDYEIRASVLRLPALLEEDEMYGGEKPFRTYSGYSYNGGYSDHLPIVLDIILQ